jgi:hypothetical protein
MNGPDKETFVSYKATLVINIHHTYSSSSG